MYRDILRMLRVKNGDTQESIAEKLKVPKRTYASWERGEREIPNDALAVIADMYNVSIDYLFGREEPSTAPDSEVRALDGGSMTVDFTELQKIKIMLEDALKQRQYAMPVDPRIVDMHERLMALNDDQLKQADIMLRVIEQMGNK